MDRNAEPGANYVLECSKHLPSNPTLLPSPRSGATQQGNLAPVHSLLPPSQPTSLAQGPTRASCSRDLLTLKGTRGMGQRVGRLRR